MKTFLTQINALDPADGQMKGWFGPRIIAETQQQAEDYCRLNGLGYCTVVGELVMEEEQDYHLN